jgi:phospholipid-binding lipoprotein MlaA
MGKHNHGDRPGFCLIALVMSALMAAATPQPVLAQEDPGSDRPPAVEEAEAPETDEAAGGADASGPAGESDAPDAEDTSAAPGREDAAGTSLMNITPAMGQNIPGDPPAPAVVPARARDPMTGADEPFEPGKGYGVVDGEDVDIGEPEVETNDPLEGMNRAFFKFNDFLDKLIFKPTAQLYRFILPSYVQDRIRNVVNNSDTPVILANDILQWKWNRAGNTASRFFINTTLGVGGIWDVASSFGIERHDEDFGQTLCVWGVNEWIYLYLPFVGPSSPRDVAGKVVDRFFDPLSYYADVVQQVDLSDGLTIRWNVDMAGMAQLSLTAADLIDLRARNIDTINEIERTSIDFYTAIRSLYRQSRENACNDGKVDFEDLPDLSEEFE